MDIKKILEEHKKWLSNDGGSCANLRGANLRRANLRRANLHGAYLRYADLHNTNLRCVDLRYADLHGADLRYANLRGANLRYANLHYANLHYADLRGADMDFSCLPLWCGSTKMRICDKLAKQFVYHALCNLDKEQMSEFLSDPIAYANGFHRVEEVGKIKR